MKQEQAQKIAVRLIGYVDWVSKKSSYYSSLHGLLMATASILMIYANFDKKFVVAFLFPAILIFGSGVYFSKVLKKARKIKEKESELVSMLMNAEGECDLKTDGSYSLTEVFEYKSVFESLKRNNSIPGSPLVTIDGIRSLLNPLPYFVILSFGWVLAVELIVLLVGMFYIFV